MTAQELIEKLKVFAPDAHVMVWSDDYSRHLEIVAVEDSHVREVVLIYPAS